MVRIGLIRVQHCYGSTCIVVHTGGSLVFCTRLQHSSATIQCLCCAVLRWLYNHGTYSNGLHTTF